MFSLHPASNTAMAASEPEPIVTYGSWVECKAPQEARTPRSFYMKRGQQRKKGEAVEEI
jgi:hypothetical protein